MSNDLINSLNVSVPSILTEIVLSRSKADLVSSFIDDWSISSCSLYINGRLNPIKCLARILLDKRIYKSIIDWGSSQSNDLDQPWKSLLGKVFCSSDNLSKFGIFSSNCIDLLWVLLIIFVEWIIV